MLGPLLAYGYRYGEVPLPKLTRIKRDVYFSDVAWVDLKKRPPTAISMGCDVLDFAEPEPDDWDPWSMVAGVCKRFAAEPPRADKARMARLRDFVRKFIRANFRPLDRESDISIEGWLAESPYPEWRKEELRRAWAEVDCIFKKRYTRCKSFRKAETYPSYKYNRGINSRTDPFKCFVGPTFKLMEKEVYKHPAFVKHIPARDRPRYIFEKLWGPGKTYLATDYTSFEALFTAELMECVEFELYDYMTRELPNRGEFMRAMREVLAGTNTCTYRGFTVELPATRMSGEMCTSLGNGFSNLMFMLFLCNELGSVVEGVVEGDDGLFAVSGPAPTTADFESLGLIIKLETHTALNTASFCGIIFDEVDLINVRDPVRVVTTFGWAGGRYASGSCRKLRALLRCKSLSLLYQFPGCPVIQSLALYGLRCTSDVRDYDVVSVLNSKGMNEYMRGLISSAFREGHDLVARPVGNRTRLLVEQKFGVSIEAQIDYERYLDELSGVQQLQPRLLPFPPVYHAYAATYVMRVGQEPNYPVIASRSSFVPLEVQAVACQNGSLRVRSRVSASRGGS